MTRQLAIPVNNSRVAPSATAMTDVRMHASGQFSQRRGARDGIGAPEVGGNPYIVARHPSGVGEEKEGARHQGGIEEIHARAAEDLLADDDGKGHGQSELPQRCGDWHNHRDDETCDQKAFVHLMVTYLREGEFDAQTDDIRHCQHGQHAKEAEPKAIPPTGHRAQLVRPIRCMEGGLVADVPHAEKHSRNEGDDDHDHGAFQIDGIANMAAALGDPIGCEGKGFKGLKSALKPCEFPALHKVRLDFVNKTT